MEQMPKVEPFYTIGVPAHLQSEWHQFYKAIYANPNDTAYYNAASDWLEEQGLSIAARAVRCGTDYLEPHNQPNDGRTAFNRIATFYRSACDAFYPLPYKVGQKLYRRVPVNGEYKLQSGTVIKVNFRSIIVKPTKFRGLVVWNGTQRVRATVRRKLWPRSKEEEIPDAQLWFKLRYNWRWHK